MNIYNRGMVMHVVSICGSAGVSCLLGALLHGVGVLVGALCESRLAPSYYHVLLCAQVVVTLSLAVELTSMVASDARPPHDLRWVLADWFRIGPRVEWARVLFIWLFCLLNALSVIYLSDASGAQDSIQRAGFPVPYWRMGGLAGENSISIAGLGCDLLSYGGIIALMKRLTRVPPANGNPTETRIGTA